MTGRTRHLSRVDSHPTPEKEPPPAFANLDSDFVVILAALLCMLVCSLLLLLDPPHRRQDVNIRSAFGGCRQQRPKKKVLNSLPKKTIGEDELSDRAEKLSDCVICLAEFAAVEEIRMLSQCDHVFHVGCIDTWLGSRAGHTGFQGVPLNRA